MLWSGRASVNGKNVSIRKILIIFHADTVERTQQLVKVHSTSIQMKRNNNCSKTGENSFRTDKNCGSHTSQTIDLNSYIIIIQIL